MTQSITPIIATLTTVAALAMSLPAHARPVQYICTVRNGFPTTIARTPQGTVSVITWKSNYFKNSDFSPLKRCQAVSARFQKHSNQGSLRYIAAGKIQNQNVLCVAQKRGGKCRGDGLLLTLEPQDNPQSVLRELFNVASRAKNDPAVRSPASELYINMDTYLQRPPNIPPATETAPGETEIPQNSTSPTPADRSKAGGTPI